MNVNLKLTAVILSTFTLLSCGKESELSKQISKLSPPPPVTESADTVKTISIGSLDDLTSFFNQINYGVESWQAGTRAVPRITFSTVPDTWQVSSKDMAVKEKKAIFFMLMLPLVLIANEEVKVERKLARSSSLRSVEFLALARKYKLTNQTPQTPNFSEEVRLKLLQRIGEIPPSLVLAQAAEESGWATSRFTVEGNAFFGQWDFSGKGMKPKHQRKALGNYGLARFNTPLDSVRGYMLNINTNTAYHKLRAKRNRMREQDKTITGLALASTLDKYSERGQAYIEGINSLITYNKLQFADDAYLSGNTTYRLITETISFR